MLQLFLLDSGILPEEGEVIMEWNHILNNIWSALHPPVAHSVHTSESQFAPVNAEIETLRPSKTGYHFLNNVVSFQSDGDKFS